MSATTVPRSDHAETLEKAFADAHQLLIYAVQTGTVVDPVIAKRIIEANHSGHGCSDENVGELLGAIAALAAQVRPVTADSLLSCRTLARRVRRYGRFERDHSRLKSGQRARANLVSKGRYRRSGSKGEHE